MSISDHAFLGERLRLRVLVEGGRVNWPVMVMGSLCDCDRRGVLGDRMCHTCWPNAGRKAWSLSKRRTQMYFFTFINTVHCVRRTKEVDR